MNHALRSRAFSLVEILIVVIILGILAAIVIPQFTNASSNARNSSTASDLTILRKQLDLFTLQHNSVPPQITGMWTLLTSRSNTSETSVAAPSGTANGPYVIAPPQNPWNNYTTITTAATDTNAGWYYTATTSSYSIYVRNADGTINYTY